MKKNNVTVWLGKNVQDRLSWLKLLKSWGEEFNTQVDEYLRIHVFQKYAT